MKDELKAVNSRMNDAEERISDLEDRIMEITQWEQQTERQTLKNESSRRDLLDNIKHASLHIIGIPEGEEREIGIKNAFEEIMLKNSHN